MLTLVHVSGEPEALTAALTYAKRGWPVAPAHGVVNGACTCKDATCGKQGGKHPRTPHGLTDATTDEAKIRAWWDKWPDSNVLIRTGKVGDRYLVALDIDPRHGGGENIEAVVAEYGGLPETPMAITGGGGVHYFMWSKHPVKNSANRIAQGVDVRGVGGYVIAAPSKHLSGGEYQWHKDLHPSDVVLAETPGWFVAMAGTAGERVRVDPEHTVGADVVEMFEGGRNNALIGLAGTIRRKGVGERAILATLRIVNEERCKPPLDDWEVERIARSAASYAPGDPLQGGGDPFPLLTPQDLAKPLEPIKWVCEGLGIAPGAVTIVGGAGFGGKTVSLQAFALAIASGKKVWNQFAVSPGRVVHIDYEQGLRLTQERYQRIAFALGIDLAQLASNALMVSSLPRGRLDDDTAEKLLHEICDGVNLLIIDAFRGAFPKADENSSSARSNLDMLQRVSEATGCAVLVIAHSRKIEEDEDPRNSLRGSGALFDAAQTVYMLQGAANKPTRVHNVKDRLLGETRETFGLVVDDVVDVHGNRRAGLSVTYVHPTEVAAAFADEGRDEGDISKNVERLQSVTLRIIAAMNVNPTGVSGEILAAMFGTPEKIVNTVLRDMVRHGSARVEGVGLHALYFKT